MHESPQNHHLDRRAVDLAANVDGDEDDLLTTRQVADLLGVSQQWLEIGRSKHYGPPFLRLSSRVIRYRKDMLRDWLNERAQHRVTRDLGEEKSGPE